tara:strand:- start:302 stop:517 length:216 start_codon:yes stop_codon:yes gene_type:complete
MIGMDWDQKKIIFGKLVKNAMNQNEKDPLLDELEERILEGPIVFTPDEEFLERLKEKEKVQETVDKNVNNC